MIYKIFLLLLFFYTGFAGDAFSADQPNSKSVVCLGRIVPGEKVYSLAPLSPYPVKSINIKRGDTVSQGAMLATLANYSTTMAALHHAEMNVKVAEGSLAQVKAGAKKSQIAAQKASVARLQSVVNNAKAKHDRNTALFERKAISASQFENSEMTLKNTQESLNSETEILTSLKEVRPVDIIVAEQQLASIKAAMKVARANVELAVIRAPIDGTILEINAYPGERAGLCGVIDMGDTSNMMVNAEVYITDISKIAVGNQAIITSPAFPGTLSGTVKEKNNMVCRNTVFNPDPFSFSDKRVVTIRIAIEEDANAVPFINSQVTVKLGL